MRNGFLALFLRFNALAFCKFLKKKTVSFFSFVSIVSFENATVYL